MDANRAAEELKVIRSLMERPIKYSTQSGLAGIVAGCAALAGVVIDSKVSQWAPASALWLNMGVWAGVFLVAFAGTVFLTRLRERRQGMPAWSLIKRRILLTILPPFVAGVGLTAAIVFRYVEHVGPNEWGLIPPVWMLFYGVACWQLGEFSVREVRVMGAAFILAGLVTAAVFQASPYEAMGITFGGFHLVYGLVVWRRHGG